MLRAVPESWFSSNFGIYEAGAPAASRPLARVSLSWVGEAGEITIEGVGHRMRREGLVSGAFVIGREGSDLARAHKPSAFFNRFEVSYRERHYELKKESVWRRRFVVLGEGGEVVGKIGPEGIFTRSVSVELPEEWELAVRVFVVWLCVILWKREGAGAGGAAGGGG